VHPKPAPTSRIYAVITADIINSRQIKDFRTKRDRILRPLSALHVRQKLLLSDYAVTAWDEFQAILQQPVFIARIILDLRKQFYPMKLRIAVGIGRVSEPHKKPVNVFAGGEAFERAREAAEQLKSQQRTKFCVLTAVASGNYIFDVIANTVYHLHDTLLEEISPKQWQAIAVQAATGNQEATARKLHVNVSTVSRTLRRAHYWQLEETRSALEQVIEAYF
jgi:SatD family (SatD)